MYVTVSRCWNILSLTGSGFDIDVGIDLDVHHCFQVLKYTQSDWNRLWHWCWHWLRCTSLFPGVEIFSVWLEPTLTLMLALTLMYVTVSRCWNILCLTGTDFDIDVGIDFDVRHCFQVLKYAQSDWKRLWHWCWHWLRCTSLFPGVEIFSVWLEPTLTLMLALT